MKLLTLAIPTYNMEKYLARCLDSVLCMNRDFIEVLVVNDGSKDRSSAIGHDYEDRYPNVIRVIDKENGNYGSCVNRAIDEATGKYFRMLDADDWCDTMALNQLMENLKSCDADLVLTVAEDRKEDGTLVRKMEAPSSVESGKCYDIVDFDGIKLGYNYLFCSHVITYKTDILRKTNLRLQHGISYTDNEYVYFPMSLCKSVVYFDFPIYQYLIGREGQTTSSEVMSKSINQIIKVFTRLWNDFVLHKSERLLSVSNNQRILLAEMAYWIYCPALTRTDTEELQPIVRNIEQMIKQDKSMIELLHRHEFDKYGVDMYKYFKTTGRFASAPIARVYLQIHRVIGYFFHILRKLA